MKFGNVKGRVRACLALLIAITAIGGAAQSAFGAGLSETYVFNPLLSLTGGCSVSELDPIADPICPKETPSGAFTAPQSIVTDDYGNIYVASYGKTTANGAEGRIDVFDATGRFLTEISDEAGPKNLAVDSKGNLYVFQFRAGALSRVDRYTPSVYNGEAGEIAYSTPPVAVTGELPNFVLGLAVNRVDDHLFVNLSRYVQEFGSAAEGNKPLDTVGKGVLGFPQGLGLAIDPTRNRLYASDARGAVGEEEFTIRVFELESPHALLRTIDGSTIPAGKFNKEPSIAVNEVTGNLFAYPEAEGKNVVDELTEEGAFVTKVDHGFKEVYGAEIGVDNGAFSPNRGYLFVPSNPSGVGHSFAFGPAPEVCAPEITSASVASVTEDEAQLQAMIEPCNLETSYTFEYTTQQSFEEEGFAGAQVAGEAEIAAGAAPVDVSVAANGLSAGIVYRFRVIAANEVGEDKAENAFSTYPTTAFYPCLNDTLRTGFSASLPDCRAYELVTPSETNARSPRGVGRLGTYFATREASPEGDKLSFEVEGGSIPGSEATGSYAGDPYLASRGGNGWSTSYAGPSGGESPALLPGSTSPDQGYSFWSTAGGEGSAAIEGKQTTYIRYPDGHSALIGRGSIGIDPRAEGKLISEDGTHIIFVSGTNFDQPVQLESNAPPDGTRTVYDRTPDEVTHVVSLLPGDKTPVEGENAFYEGTSSDGTGISFRIGKTLYLRYDNEETYEIGENLTFAGIADGGGRIFYLESDDLWAYKVATEKRIRFSNSGDVIVVNVASDGSAAYFVSPSVLTGEPNPNGATPQNGKENLYLSREGVISFVGTLLEEDVLEQDGVGLEVWTPHVASYGEAGEDPSRTTRDGSVLLFQSRAALDGYNPEGHIEIYRYDSVGSELDCLSCNPTGAAATGEATLQSMIRSIGDPEPFGPFALVANLSADGRRAFFQSTEPLAVRDTDGLQDVYEWEAEGVGSCTRPGGCVYLISSGESKRTNYLYAVSDNGNDVFFRSGDLLLPADGEETPSIYDARVEGGFAEEPTAICEGESCRPGLPAPPPMLIPESGVHTPPQKGRTCPKGERKVRQGGRVRCVKKHHRHRHRRAGSNKKGGSK